jgi:hypothetical protein
MVLCSLLVVGDGLSVVVDREGAQVRTEWKLNELIGAWTLVEGDWKLIANKTGATRLGAVMLAARSLGGQHSGQGGFPAIPGERQGNTGRSRLGQGTGRAGREAGHG